MFKWAHCSPFFIGSVLFVAKKPTKGEEVIIVKLQSIVESALKGLNYELVDLELIQNGLIRVFIDKPGGVSIDDCTLVRNHLSRLFMVENFDYQRLEISSPGLDRPLKKAQDFEKYIGEQAKVQLRVALDPIENRRRFVGKIVGVEDKNLQLEVDGEVLTLPLDLIDKARLDPKY